jgi:hypothetical protein
MGPGFQESTQSFRPHWIIPEASIGHNCNLAINTRKAKQGIVPKTMTRTVILGKTMGKAV